MLIDVLVVLIVCVLFYWNIVSYPKDVPNPYPSRSDEQLEDQNTSITPPSFDFTNQEINTSNGQSWKFSIPDDYIYVDRTISPKDECYGQEDGFQLEATGERLYNFLQRNQAYNNKILSPQTNIDRAIQNGKKFYFECRHNKIAGVYACDPGDVFESNRCVPINPCTNEPNEKFFPDPENKNYFFQCHNGHPEHKKCPNNMIFFLDQCIPKSNTFVFCQDEKDGTILPINDRTYVECYRNRATYHTCPDNTNFFPSTKRCERNECIGYPDGHLRPLPLVKRGPFTFSPGYMECEGGRIKNIVQCPDLWDHYMSKGDNLTHLPTVFHNNTCTVPSFCDNVQPDTPDIIVPVHEFTKFVQNSDFSASFDAAVGIRCENQQRHRVVLEPGMHIFDYQIESACTTTSTVVAIGDTVDRYYDCATKSVVSCPHNTFFNGKECQKILSRAHYYKNVPIFKMDNLSPLNDWMTTTTTTPQPIPPDDPEYEYLPKYHVWSHKDCSRYPFLSQVKYSLFLPDGNHFCKFKHGKITKLRYRNKFRLKYWSQRYVPDSSEFQDECYPGMKIRIGHFVMDNIFYATCDPIQPFVFCPSASTDGIEKIYDIWACKPHDRVYEAMLPAEKVEKVMGLERFVPQPGATYTMNGIAFEYDEKEHPNGIYVNKKPVVTLWSERPIKLYFQTLETYPPDIYLLHKQWRRSVGTRHLPFHSALYDE